MTATRAWRLRKQRYNLCSESCPVCAAVHFPPREVCRVCGAPQHLALVAILPAFARLAEALIPTS
jgi:uncharacterized OB-fold protein